MPQFDVSTFSSQVIWLAITFVVLYLLMAKVALPRIGNVIAERQQRIESNLTQAEELRAGAKTDSEAYDRALLKAREEARNAIQAAAQAAAQEAAAKSEALNQRLAAQIKSAETEIERAKANARASIREAAAGVAQAATQRLIGVAPSDAEATAAVDAALQGKA